MKKVVSILAVILIFTNITIIADEHEFSVADTIRSFMLANYPVALEKVTEKRNEYLENGFQTLMDYKKLMGDQYTDEELQKEHEDYFDHLGVIPEYSFYFYPFVTMRYTKQYADILNFEKLIGDDKIWADGCKEGTKTKASYRTLPLAPKIKEYLEQLKEKQAEKSCLLCHSFTMLQNFYLYVNTCLSFLDYTILYIKIQGFEVILSTNLSPSKLSNSICVMFCSK